MSAPGLEADEVRTEARRLLDAECSSAQVRRTMASGREWDARLWESMVEAGWPGLSAPEPFGGVAAGAPATAVLLEELGAHCAGGPLVPSLLAAWAVDEGGSEEQRRRWLPGLAAGTRIGSVAPGGASGHVGPGAIELTATRRAGGWHLSGTTGVVASAQQCDLLVVPARQGPGTVGCFVVEPGHEAVEMVAQPTWDPTRATASVRLDGLDLDEDRRLGGPDLYGRLVSRGAWMVACDSLGVAARCLDMTKTHGVNRSQFGRPIGSFEAWKHRSVDLFVRLQEARMAVRHANGLLTRAAAADGGAGAQLDDPDLVFAASAAKFLAGDNAVEIAGASIQLHGAIGFTWEHDLHLFLKRALVNRSLFGDSAYHRERAAQALLGGRT